MAALTLWPQAAGATSPTFSATYVSTTLAGGEPFVVYSSVGKDLVYSSHEGTTHIDRTYATTVDASCDILPPKVAPPSGFVCAPYDNQINIWYSSNGRTWTKSTENPLYTGFSDPSLTTDAAGNVYDTGINLANDAVYVSSDGGKSWLTGTSDCHDGDRPWLSGGVPGEVFMATDTVEDGHETFHGTVVGPQIVCNQNGLTDPHGSDSQQYYAVLKDDKVGHGDLVEADAFPDGGFGIGVLEDAPHVWASTTAAPSASWQDFEGINCKTHAADCSELGPIAPEIAFDRGGTVYVVWATNPRSTNPSDNNGCGGGATGTGLSAPGILPNSIEMIATSDEGQTWRGPYTIANPKTSGGNTMIWPWVVGGSAGNISVAWYQANQLTDPDCDSAAQLPGGKPTRWTIRDATITNALSTSYPAASVNVLTNFDGLHPGGVFHVGGICQSGTTCVATGQDRRLGDYFTTALDQNGCVMIATADTMVKKEDQQLYIGLPLFVRQTGGTSLTTGKPCGTVSATTQQSGASPLAVAGISSATIVLLAARRRRQTR